MPRKQPATSPHQQRGIAILTTLVIAVLVVTLAAVIFARQSRAVRQTDNYQSLERAWQYAYSIEQFVGMELVRDAKTNKYDALNDDWAIDLPALPLEEGNGVQVGTVEAKLEDLQGRFNLNSIMDEKGKENTQGQMDTLRELAESAGLPTSFADTVFDWMDSDTTLKTGDSAESSYYLSGSIPYYAADMPLADVSEIRLLRLDMAEPEQKEEALQQFLDNVTALPFPTSVNANTASETTLSAMGLDADRIKTIMEARNPDNEQPFKTTADLFAALNFSTDPKSKDVALKARLEKTLDVSSSYFRLKGQIKLGRARVFLNSVFYREPGKPIRVIMRQFDRVNEPETTTNDDVSNTPTES